MDGNDRVKKKTVLLMIPNLGTGGAQKVFLDQFYFFSESFRVIGCVFNLDDVSNPDITSLIISLNIPAGKNVFGKFISFVRRIRVVRKIKIDYQIDVSISHLEGADYVNVLSRYNDRIVCWIHGSKKFDRNIRGMLGFIRKKLFMPWTYQKADELFVVSDAIGKEVELLAALPHGKVRTLHNGIDIEKIDNEAERPFNFQHFHSKGFFIVITHCRLAAEKNLIALIKIFSDLRMKLPAVKLVVLGDGALRMELEKKCNELDLPAYFAWKQEEWTFDRSVYFMGLQSNPYGYLKAASLFVLPSLNEGFPLSLCEAMACGLPVVCSDCHTGPREIIAPEISATITGRSPQKTSAGILMPVPDSVETCAVWSDYLVGLIPDNRTLTELGQKAKMRARNFDIKSTHKKWLQIVA